MPISYRIDPEHQILRVEVLGSSDIAADAAVYEAFRADPSYRTGMPILIDDRRRTGDAADTSEVRWLAKAVSGPRPEFAGVRLAILVTSDAQYGMSRMFAALSEKGSLRVEIFREEAAALRWLAGGPGATP